MARPAPPAPPRKNSPDDRQALANERFADERPSDEWLPDQEYMSEPQRPAVAQAPGKPARQAPGEAAVRGTGEAAWQARGEATQPATRFHPAARSQPLTPRRANSESMMRADPEPLTPRPDPEPMMREDAEPIMPQRGDTERASLRQEDATGRAKAGTKAAFRDPAGVTLAGTLTDDAADVDASDPAENARLTEALRPAKRQKRDIAETALLILMALIAASLSAAVVLFLF